MKILLINHYAGSDRMGMEYRPFYFAREWATAGHEVTILAADHSHLRGRQPRVGADLEVTDEEGVRFRWIRTPPYAGNGIGRVANMLTFAGKLRAYANRLAREERPEIVVCSSTYPLDIFGGERIADKAHARLVFEVHDLWPLTPVLLGGYSPRHPYIRLLQRAEDRAYRVSDATVSLLPCALDYMVGRGLRPGKFVHIPNGVPVSWQSPPESSELPEAARALIDRERGRGRFLIGFAGGLNLNMAVETLLAAAQGLDSLGVSFFIAGDGLKFSDLRAQAERSRLDCFHMLGRIPKLAVPAFLSRMDALAIPWHRNPLYRYGQSPNKLFDYMLTGKPILQANDAANDLVAEAKCGFTILPESPEAFVAAVEKLRELPEEERQKMGRNGRNFALLHHDCTHLARRFLEEVLSRPCGAPAPRRSGRRFPPVPLPIRPR